MKTYRIENTVSAVILGDYEADTTEEALDAMARDAGYRNQEHAMEITKTDGSELHVYEIDDGA